MEPHVSAPLSHALPDDPGFKPLPPSPRLRTPTSFPALLSLIVRVDRARRNISLELTRIKAEFQDRIDEPSRLVPEVVGQFPDGSPSRVGLGLLFQRPGVQAASGAENLVRHFTRPLTRAVLYRLGALKNSDLILTFKERVDGLNRASKTLNRVGLSITKYMAHHSRPRPSEPLIPPAPPHMIRAPRFAFPKSVILDAWAFSVRISRLAQDQEDLAHAYRRDPPTSRLMLVFSRDPARLRWRLRPEHTWLSRVTERSMRALRLPKSIRRRILDLEKLRRVLERSTARFNRISLLITSKAIAAIEMSERATAASSSSPLPSPE